MGRLVAAAVILLIALLGLRVAGAPIFPWNASSQTANNVNPNANGTNPNANGTNPNANGTNPNANGTNPGNSSNAIDRLFSQQNPSGPIQPVPQTRSTGFSSEVPTTADSNNPSGQTPNPGTSLPPEQPSGPVRGSW